MAAEWARIAASSVDATTALAANPYHADTRLALINAGLADAENGVVELPDVTALAHEGRLLHREDGRFDSALGAAAVLGGNEELAHDHFAAALAKTPDDGLAMRAQFIGAVLDKDKPQALGHLIRLSYRWPSQLDLLRPWILQLFQGADFRELAAVQLEDKDLPRTRIVAQLLKDDAGLNAALDLMTLWRRSGRADVTGQGALLVNALRNADRLTEAVLFDRMIFGAERSDEGGYVNNGAFSTAPSRSPFDWRFPKVNGLSIGRINLHESDQVELLQATTGHEVLSDRKAMRITFLNSPVQLRQSEWQVLSLPSGAYRLEITFRISADHSGPEPVRLELRCDAAPDATAHITLKANKGEWTRLNQSFEHDDSKKGCKTPYLTFTTEFVAQSWRNQFSGHIDIGLVRLVQRP